MPQLNTILMVQNIDKLSFSQNLFIDWMNEWTNYKS